MASDLDSHRSTAPIHAIMDSYVQHSSACRKASTMSYGSAEKSIRIAEHLARACSSMRAKCVFHASGLSFGVPFAWHLASSP